jgi:hypothetical protein
VTSQIYVTSHIFPREKKRLRFLAGAFWFDGNRFRDLPGDVLDGMRLGHRRHFEFLGHRRDAAHGDRVVIPVSRPWPSAATVDRVNGETAR